MTSGPDPQLDAYIASVEAALADLRRYVGQAAEQPPAAPVVMEPERRTDLIGREWIETGSAASRFEISKFRVLAWCQRDGSFGWKRGGRWFVSISKVQAKLGIR
ncbi:hypothetical protein EN962_13945 [Mesorhizobium sp. M7A.F.Ca.CA.001.09.2.1]|uniref:hypothetical protein n=1 Tax=unclassified Mesorhizobium TaxID=325217 RepID=UPI0004669EB0|nr:MULTISPECIES: hypothetical protein [unclassified Mesorhizobium]RUY62992.1 hypothetical protein EN965_23955 [Mesorhizobium sp. M7A.F.Ca.CA.001.05.1.1]RUY65229.1 hypothetical protein EN980_23320 [Mesorhizobium sp. M7A.F.Ca.CA.001.13.1.1]RUY78062.1 hypothetical protein EN962_13945 [Mesorhizobium sp. M7A.F.Ca.CA.001.09.2.1]RUZ23458.1 hypothetical protein EN961_08670 [Mesorhizobium sp. M7A.F.Ca.CA.001.09.1.1]RUZ38089.1 hypothetical protein EN952_19760 [Mesorhizobium sp. M7A.F.Ca.CA.001.15.1.1]